MGRHVLNVPRHAENSSSLRNMTTVEERVSLAYVTTMLVLACGCLSFTALIPYVSSHRWILFLIASTSLVLINVRDLWLVVQLYCSLESSKPKLQSAGQRIPRIAAACILNADTTSATLMLVGSLMLMNSSIIAFLYGDEGPVACWQFVGAFAIYTVGYGCNTLRFHDDCLEVMETRNAVVFQMSMSATLNLIGALANVPGIVCSETDELRATLRSWLHGLAGLIAFGGALVNHFHVHAFMTNEEILLAERRYRAVKAKEEEEVEALSNRSAVQKVWSLVSKGVARVMRRRDSETFQILDRGYPHNDDDVDTQVSVLHSEVSDEYSEYSGVEEHSLGNDEKGSASDINEIDGSPSSHKPEQPLKTANMQLTAGRENELGTQDESILLGRDISAECREIDNGTFRPRADSSQRNRRRSRDAGGPSYDSHRRGRRRRRSRSPKR